MAVLAPVAAWVAMNAGTIAAVATVAGTAMSYYGQQKAQSEARSNAAMANKEREGALATQKEQQALQQRQAAIERQRSIRQAIAQRRVLQAQGVSAMGAMGDSSTVAGANSAIGTDQATAIGAANTGLAASVQMSNLQTMYNTQVGNMQYYANKPVGSNVWSDMGSLFGSFGNKQTVSNVGAGLGWAAGV